jgi:hypothetical protein
MRKIFFVILLSLIIRNFSYSQNQLYEKYVFGIDYSHTGIDACMLNLLSTSKYYIYIHNWNTHDILDSDYLAKENIYYTTIN